MLTDEFKSLIAKGETLTFEFKAGVTRPEIIAKILGAFANTKGGTIAFGIQEPDIIVGTDPDRTKKVIDVASSMLQPHEKVEVEQLNLDGKSIVLAHIQRSSTLVAVQGIYFTRRGHTIHTITADEIKYHFDKIAPEKDATYELAKAVEEQTKRIEKLTNDFAKANSMKRKILIATIGAAVGAILKSIFSAMIG